ncbi:MAG: beta-ketoacyl-ACP reductase [Planctomycetes bacterium]|jgi:3-oxoacyl-[acyl-carrier protein] reductase|nr:beta-ketoacyl-ACP reductase [Planctomycetota bacterium]MBT4029656.1 beta-ketoacyl-ACP reductase [Planctomycetota bacterium]MBT4561156.1 beta-ketoacyl-ACP reductase [Planctomycetota bacterium]MBT5101092.1 beta-ketoacyl-ACP reductase [Planctomycetota bacterium]MBT7011727.1 beta-ketoacyl-ACP reductase [Planctomycetota bacterium]
MSDSLNDQRFLVTGASRGIGKAIALDLASRGAKVAGLATSLGNLSSTQSEIEAAGGTFLPLAGDISDPQTAIDAVKAVTDAWGGIDGLVANAGITRDNLLLRMSADDFNTVIGTNLTGSFHFVKAVTKPMMRQKAGRIVLVGSVVATIGNPGQANYCAAKAGLHGLARSVAIELGSRGITTNVVAPGFIQTDMTEALDEKAQEAMMSKIALRRPGLPSDVAGAVRFLLGPSGGYLTGQVIVVDGGLSLG